MPASARSGRPRASSRETIAEAAGELFLERGYDATSVADITQRAGVGRSSFFNYFASKADVLWSGLDDRIGRAEEALAGGAGVRAALAEIAEDFAPDSLALAITHAQVMGLGSEWERERAVRQARVQRAVAVRFVREGAGDLHAEVAAAAYAGAVLAAVWTWADRAGSGASLPDVLDRALDLAARAAP
ncbi:TetR/AcrR family transcriptional regulator [Microbacterium sp. cx-59]|uniref:TetR/AcrR family transcriptional regulator n=1 Tax=Microbacterium sp. cx-59 TaxID=2891207 RepID=UPI001E391256|nr:TetR/AcrR family transcriptional regulator [Microbacterium sp. cx-59]MCC4907114.1 TetR/AcrR family transcriptional regulator [Microbacterium sp. cx-59]